MMDVAARVCRIGSIFWSETKPPMLAEVGIDGPSSERQIYSRWTKRCVALALR